MTPYKYGFGQRLSTDAKIAVDRGFVAHYNIPAADAVAASTTGVHAAMNSTGTPLVVTTGITNPAVPRNVTATAGGTATDIKAIQVVVAGTDFADEAITETLPAFTVDTAGSVAGNKAFKTITSISVPNHDGNGATTAIGFGDKLGLPYKLPHNTVIETYVDNAKEATAPTVTTSVTVLDGNTLDPNTALNGKVVDIYLIV